MATFSDLETSVRAQADQPDTGRTPQALILAVANEEYESVVRRLAAQVPDLYATFSAEISITDVATNYLDIASITDLMQIVEVQRKVGTKWFGMDPSGPNPEVDPKLTWRQRGISGTGTKVDIFPAEDSVATYRVRYCAFPGALSGGSSTIKLPIGGLLYLAACVTPRIRDREEEDPAFMASVRDNAFAALVRDLQPKGGVISTRGRY